VCVGSFPTILGSFHFCTYTGGPFRSGLLMTSAAPCRRQRLKGHRGLGYSFDLDDGYGHKTGEVEGGGADYPLHIPKGDLQWHCGDVDIVGELHEGNESAQLCLLELQKILNERYGSASWVKTLLFLHCLWFLNAVLREDWMFTSSTVLGWTLDGTLGATVRLSALESSSLPDIIKGINWGRVHLQ